jgi:hypothetical protein
MYIDITNCPYQILLDYNLALEMASNPCGRLSV